MNKCLCCGDPCKDETNYVRGHSAKHASSLAKEVVFGGMKIESALAQLPTDKLKVTLTRYVETMSRTEFEVQRQRERRQAVRNQDGLKVHASADNVNAKYVHEPTPVDDCGERISFGVYCTNRLPCRRHHDD